VTGQALVLGRKLVVLREFRAEDVDDAMAVVGDDRITEFLSFDSRNPEQAAADHWGRGYATDAVRTMLDFGFGMLDLHRVTAAIGPDNAASLALAQKLGFTFEGRLRDHVFTNGAWRDSLLYSILSREWADFSEREAQRAT
jgi:ribosomal-protein-alanine N-acetyltransferase